MYWAKLWKKFARENLHGSNVLRVKLLNYMLLKPLGVTGN